jgi:hypothetical protein
MQSQLEWWKTYRHRYVVIKQNQRHIAALYACQLRILHEIQPAGTLPNLRFPSTPPNIFGASTPVTHEHLYFKSFIIRHASVILSFDAKWPNTLKESLNKS